MIGGSSPEKGHDRASLGSLAQRPECEIMPSVDSTSCFCQSKNSSGGIRHAINQDNNDALREHDAWEAQPMCIRVVEISEV